jgi:hypothetical protein
MPVGKKGSGGVCHLKAIAIGGMDWSGKQALFAGSIFTLD